jgi:ankyrin repeat protein
MTGLRAYPTRIQGLVLALLLTASSVSATQADQRLVDAAKAQDHASVTALVEQQADVNVPQPDGATALHWAAHWDALDTADLLIGAGADVDAANDYGVTPLALACDNGAGAMVARLLEAGASPNAERSTGETPLMTCARTGSLEAVWALLDHGADPGASESWRGQTALMWAAGEGHTEVARALIETAPGVDVDARSSNGFTALLIAAREDAPELARLLLDAGADVNAAAPDGTTPLVVAAVRGHSALAIALLEQGADPNADGTGYTALHWASGSWHTELTGSLRGIETARDDEWRSLNDVRTGKQQLVEALLAHGADPHARLVRSPPQFGYASGRFRVSLAGATPFLLAAMDGNVDVMRALAGAGADPKVGTDELTTPLMVAAGLGQVPAETRVAEGDSLAAVTFVLELGADVNAINDIGRTALHGAAHIRSDAIVQLLADHGALLNAEDVRGITPLMIAEGGGHVLLPGLGGGSTSELLRALGSEEMAPSSVIENFNQGAIR